MEISKFEEFLHNFFYNFAHAFRFRCCIMFCIKKWLRTFSRAFYEQINTSTLRDRPLRARALGRTGDASRFEVHATAQASFGYITVLSYL